MFAHEISNKVKNNAEILNEVAHACGFKSSESMFVGLGIGKLSTYHVIEKMYRQGSFGKWAIFGLAYKDAENCMVSFGACGYGWNVEDCDGEVDFGYYLCITPAPGLLSLK